MISKLKYEYLLFLIAIIWISFFAFVLQLKPYLSLIGDDSNYLNSAKLLYFDHKLDDTRPLLISAIHGLPFVFGFSSAIVIKWGLFINFCSWLLTDIFLFKIIAQRFNRKVAFVFSIIFILCIGNLAHAFNFLPESLYIFLILLSIYFVNKFYQTSKIDYLALAISVLLFNSLIKPVSLGLALIVTIFFITKFRKVIFNKFSMLIAISLFLIFFQMNSLKKNYGDFTISYIGTITYYNYIGAKADCYRKNIEYIPGRNDRTRKMKKLSDHEMNKLANEDFKEQLTNNTSNLIKAYFYCIYSNTYKGNFIVSECKNVKGKIYFNVFYYLFKAISKLQNILFTITGVFLSFYFLIRFKKEDPFYLLVSTFILYIFFISGMSCFQCDRFHIAFFPFVLLFLAKFLVDRYSFFNNKSITNTNEK